MTLPLTKADLARLEPTQGSMQQQSFIKITTTLFDNLVFQARQAIEMEEVLEWLFDYKEKECIYMIKIDDRYVFKYRNREKAIFYSLFGETPLAAIQAAMKAEKEK